MPSPQAAAIILSDSQQTLLEQIVRRTTNPHRLVRRAQLLLAAAVGTSNTQISQQLQLERGQVRKKANTMASRCIPSSPGRSRKRHRATALVAYY